MTRLLALASLLACLAFPLLYFRGEISMQTYKTLFVAGSLAWFVFATLEVARRSPKS